VPERRLGSGCPLILVDDPAEDVVASERPAARALLGHTGDRGRQVQPTVGPCGVVVRNEISDDAFEVSPADYEHEIEALGSRRAHEPLGVRVRLGDRTGVFRTSMPAEENTASKLRVNLVSRSRTSDVPPPRERRRSSALLG
jgi:hypothetical protein